MTYREFLENSTFHKQQTLGRNSQYSLKMRLPPLKKDFVPKPREANFFKKTTPTLDDHKVKVKEYKPLPQVDRIPVENIKPKQNTSQKSQNYEVHSGPQVVYKVPVETKNQVKPEVEKQKSTELKGTNTLTYSETVKPDTNGDSGNCKPSEVDDTVFKFTDKHSHRHEHGIAEVIHDGDDDEISHVVTESKKEYYQEALTKSQNFEWPPEKQTFENVTKSNFLDSKVSAKIDSNQKDEKDQDESEIIDEKDLSDLYAKRSKLVPEFRCVWFQFHTDAIYCNISSLAVIKEGIVYGIPFGIAKIVLKTRSTLKQFLNSCQFVSGGSIKYSYAMIEDLKSSKSEHDHEFDIDTIDIRGHALHIEYTI